MFLLILNFGQMEKFRCLIADDNELDRLTLLSYLSYFSEIEIVGVFAHPELALEVVQSTEIDILFLDVDMPGMSGLELRRKIKEVPICIFATDHPEFAVESFELETLDYLIKPFTLERFKQTMSRINEYMRIRKQANLFESHNERNYFFFKDGHKKIKIDLDEVLYLSALQNYTSIITAEEKQYVLSTLGTLLKEDTFHSFVRIHKSYAVNKKAVSSIGAKEIIISNGISVPVGRSYRENLKDLLR